MGSYDFGSTKTYFFVYINVYMLVIVNKSLDRRPISFFLYYRKIN